MPDLTYAQRAAVCSWLDGTARQLVDGAGILRQLGYPMAAAGLERAAVELGAAAWICWAAVLEGWCQPPPRPAEADGYRA